MNWSILGLGSRGKSSVVSSAVPINQFALEARSALVASQESFSVIVKVDRSKTPEQLGRETRRQKYGDSWVFQTIPRIGKSGIEEVELVFFHADPFDTPAEIDAEYRKRELITDVYAQFAVNEQDLLFCDSFWNMAVWPFNGGLAWASFWSYPNGDRRTYRTNISHCGKFSECSYGDNLEETFKRKWFAGRPISK